MKNLKYFLFFVSFASSCILPAAPAYTYKHSELSLITRLTTWLLLRNHYRTPNLDHKFSKTFFNEYFDTLDPQRIYFTQEDVKRFGIYQNGLGTHLLHGRNDFAFRLYALYRERLAEFIVFAEKTCAKPQDFTKDEYWELNRDKAQRPANRKEQYELWRLRIKNDLLFSRLQDRAMAEDKNTAKDKRQAAAAAAWKWGSSSPEKNLQKRLRDISNEVMKKDSIDILGIYLNTLANVFGPHSNYLAPKLSEDFDINMSLSLTGIGATLSTENGFIKVVAIVPGGPAGRDGNLKEEDRIAVVVQENLEAVNLIDMPVSQAVRYIRGPKDSKLCLGVLTDKRGINPLPVNSLITFSRYFSRLTGLPDISGIFPEWRGKIYLRPYILTRSKVELVDSGAKGKIHKIKTPDGKGIKIGVLELPSFYHDFNALRRGETNVKRCSRDVEKILQDFNKKQVDCVLFDLRFNGGGSLAEAIETTGLFIKNGPVVQVRMSNNARNVEMDNNSKIVYTGPLVILTSKLSASASEIFAAALQDCGRAIVVGDSRTFGKGTILEVEDLSPHFRWLARKIPAGSTTFEKAMFYRINGSSVQQLGVSPDIQLPSLTEELKVGEMFLPHHLPWDKISPVPCRIFDTDIKRKAALLKQASRKRIAVSPEYGRLLKRIRTYRAHKNRKRISLKEAVRWAEYRSEKELEEAADKLLSRDLENSKKEKVKDPILDEAVNIAVDYARLTQKK